MYQIGLKLLKNSAAALPSPSPIPWFCLGGDDVRREPMGGGRNSMGRHGWCVVELLRVIIGVGRSVSGLYWLISISFFSISVGFIFLASIRTYTGNNTIVFPLESDYTQTLNPRSGWVWSFDPFFLEMTCGPDLLNQCIAAFQSLTIHFQEP